MCDSKVSPWVPVHQLLERLLLLSGSWEPKGQQSLVGSDGGGPYKLIFGHTQCQASAT